MKCPKCCHIFTVKKGKKKQYLGFVFLTDDEYKKLVEKFGVQGTRDRIKNLDDGIAIKGYKYKDHYRVILKWASSGPMTVSLLVFTLRPSSSSQSSSPGTARTVV